MFFPKISPKFCLATCHMSKMSFCNEISGKSTHFNRFYAFLHRLVKTDDAAECRVKNNDHFLSESDHKPTLASIKISNMIFGILRIKLEGLDMKIGKTSKFIKK